MFLVAPGHPKEVGALRLCARDGGPEPGPQIIPPGKTYPPEKVRPPKVQAKHKIGLLDNQLQPTGYALK